MKILFLTLAITDMKGNGLYVDLLRELRNRGNDVYVVCPIERKNNEITNLIVEESISFLRVKTGNITKTNFIEKGISTILIEKQYVKSINSFYSDLCFDLVIYTTPPVTFEKVINYIKKRDNCLSYLILKDIFPQNAVDLELFKKSGMLYKYFRMKEKKLYRISDFIGCTSNGNINYIKRNNPEIDPDKIEMFPNSILPRNLKSRSVALIDMRKKYGIPSDSVVFVYGGNIGRPQGIDFIKAIISRANEKDNIFFMILGSGTDFNNLSDYIKRTGFSNVSIMNGVNKDEYWDFLTCCDVGLIFLDNRFTVPNTPARLTYYMEAGLPILAATDISTDVNDILKESKSGFWVESGDVESFYLKVDLLLNNPELRNELGKNGRKYMEDNLNINRNYNVLMNHFEKGDYSNV